MLRSPASSNGSPQHRLGVRGATNRSASPRSRGFVEDAVSQSRKAIERSKRAHDFSSKPRFEHSARDRNLKDTVNGHLKALGEPVRVTEDLLRVRTLLEVTGDLEKNLGEVSMAVRNYLKNNNDLPFTNAEMSKHRQNVIRQLRNHLAIAIRKDEEEAVKRTLELAKLLEGRFPYVVGVMKIEECVAAKEYLKDKPQTPDAQTMLTQSSEFAVVEEARQQEPEETNLQQLLQEELLPHEQELQQEQEHLRLQQEQEQERRQQEIFLEQQRQQQEQEQLLEQQRAQERLRKQQLEQQRAQEQLLEQQLEQQRAQEQLLEQQRQQEQLACQDQQDAEQYQQMQQEDQARDIEPQTHEQQAEGLLLDQFLEEEDNDSRDDEEDDEESEGSVEMHEMPTETF